MDISQSRRSTATPSDRRPGTDGDPGHFANTAPADPASPVMPSEVAREPQPVVHGVETGPRASGPTVRQHASRTGPVLALLGGTLGDSYHWGPAGALYGVLAGLITLVGGWWLRRRLAAQLSPGAGR